MLINKEGGRVLFRFDAEKIFNSVSAEGVKVLLRPICWMCQQLGNLWDEFDQFTRKKLEMVTRAQAGFYKSLLQ